MNRTVFFANIRRGLYRDRLPQQAVDGFNALLDAAPPAWPEDWLAYALATAYHETAYTMQPVRETLAASDREAVRRLEAAWRAGRLRQVREPYWRFDAQGQTWLGRGYVQLTHRVNYERAGRELGLDLTSEPADVMRPAVAAAILFQGMEKGLFTGKHLRGYTRGGKLNFKDARRIINGADRDELIAGYARVILEALTAARVADWSEETTATQQDKSDATPTGKTPAASSTIWAQILAVLSTLGTAGLQALGALDWRVAAVITTGAVAAFAVWTIRERMQKSYREGV